MIKRASILILVATACAYAQDGSNLLAPTVVRDLSAEAPAYFSLDENRSVPMNEVHADPSSWHIAFSNTAITVNGGVVLVDESFDELVEAPADGYADENVPEGTPVPGGSATGWYRYDMDVHVISPIPERTIVLRTRDGHYAKVGILSYYKGGADGLGDPRYYTFQYALQSDGSRDLATSPCSEDSMECSIEG